MSDVTRNRSWKHGAEFGVEAILRVQQHEQSLASIEHELDEDGRVQAIAWKRLLDAVGVPGPSSPIDSEWGTHGHTNPADIQTTHLGAGSTYDPAIHQEP